MRFLLELLAGLLCVMTNLTCASLTSPITSTDKNAEMKATLPDLYEASIAELQAGLEKGLFTSVDLVKVQ